MAGLKDNLETDRQTDRQTDRVISGKILNKLHLTGCCTLTC